MCKTCKGSNSELTNTESLGKTIQKNYRPQARMSFPEGRKNLNWKEAILKTTMMYVIKTIELI